MRKQSIFVRCDGNGCREVGEVAELRDTPAEWYHVRQADELDHLKPDGFDFHSLRCIERWARERRLALEPSSRGRESAEQTVRVAVSTLLEGAPEFTSTQVRELSGAVQSTVDRHLGRLVAAGELVAISVNGRTRTYRGGGHEDS